MLPEEQVLYINRYGERHMKIIFGGITALVGAVLVWGGIHEGQTMMWVIGGVIAYTGYKVVTS